MECFNWHFIGIHTKSLFFESHVLLVFLNRLFIILNISFSFLGIRQVHVPDRRSGRAGDRPVREGRAHLRGVFRESSLLRSARKNTDNRSAKRSQSGNEENNLLVLTVNT